MVRHLLHVAVSEDKRTCMGIALLRQLYMLIYAPFLAAWYLAVPDHLRGIWPYRE